MKRGFTLIELLVGMGILGIIFVMVTFSYIQTTRRADLKRETAAILQTLRQAQAEAISQRVSPGGSLTPYGVHFETQSYTLFVGTSFNPAEPRNVRTEIPSSLGLNLNLPSDHNVIFSPLEGEVSGFSPSQNQIQVLEGATGQTRTITFNQMGVIDQE